MSSLHYQSGWGNHFESEALAGTLPQGQNSPQKAARKLYAEQLSGSAFTMARSENLRSWLYRLQPSVVRGEFELLPEKLWKPPIYQRTSQPHSFALAASSRAQPKL